MEPRENANRNSGHLTSRPLAPLSISERIRFFCAQPLVRFVVVGAIIVLCGGYFVASRENIDHPAPQSFPVATVAATTVPSIKVYVTGAVVTPGVVTIESSARVNDAIAAAGGIQPNAVLTSCNLAAFVNDGDAIVVPAVDDGDGCTGNSTPITGASRGEKGESPGVSSKVNLNTATKSELESLPGVGPTLAEAIMEYRKQTGKFSSVSDLQKVKGIGEKRYSDLQVLVSV